MKAMVLTEYKHLEIQELPVPDVGPDDVLVEVKACGICGSDIHGYDGSTGRRIPPLVMGHEAAGVVSQVGSGVSEFQVGQRVTFDSMVWCGKCHYCYRGQSNLCDHRRVLGVSCDEYRRNGAFAQFVCVPKHIVYSLPEKVSFEQAALIEAISVAVHAAERTPVNLGDTAVVVGSGMIGLLVIQAIKLAGCSQVIAIDLNASRLQVARQLGADYTIKADEEDAIARVKELTNQRGADVALEVVGATPTIKTAIDCTRKGGTVTLVGNVTPNIDLPLQSVVTRELSVLGSCASAGEYPACIKLLETGLIQVEPLISAKISLDQGPQWFERLHKGDANIMKVLVCP